ncbi:MAG: NAD(P)H-dependent oxidoreductase [Candidatus Micrarchaeota archaeon]|nr:NAD(P)H-dependent oxidoreductase [Candidatus Micrarchaeota archaeon]MDE1859318.1 NAD(P)H-dependent oxidoreductase [Candidatus Micrarchaeota archaeon]
MGKIKILGIAGSLRRGSYNRAMLDAAQGLVPEDSQLEIADIANMPMFNQEYENDMPQSVKEFKARVKAADAILIATPEYNYSIPGVLKNAMDWASRPYTDNSWAGKPVAVMSAATGMIGGERAQLQLRQSFVYLDMHAVNKPEVIVTFAAKKFDENGNLIDEGTKELIAQLLCALVSFTKKLNGTK